MDGQVLRFRLRGGSDAVPSARRIVDRVAEKCTLPRLGDLRLLVSELVTNSVLHASAGPDNWLELCLVATDRSLRVEVCDESTGWQPEPRAAQLDEPGGWGLFIVEQLAARWGLSRDGQTCVWFELDQEPAETARQN
ncbi:MAG: ATP-binding protein [Gaiellaceae bacterium]